MAQVHAKVYGLPFDHFNNNTEGPLSWVNSGTVDIDMYVELPHEETTQPREEVRRRPPTLARAARLHGGVASVLTWRPARSPEPRNGTGRCNGTLC